MKTARRTFESLLSELSSRFISLPHTLIDQEIQDGLKKIAELLNTDRAGLMEVKESDIIVRHIWARPDVIQSETFSLTSVPWYRQNLLAARPIIYENLLEELPPEAKEEREYCLTTGLKSIATIPIFIAESFFGAISTGSFRRHRKWSKKTITRLRLFGELFSNALARRRSELQIQEHISQLENQYQFERLISDLSSQFVTTPKEQIDQRIERTLERLLIRFQMDRLALLKVSRDQKIAIVTHSANGPDITAAPTVINYVQYFPWHAAKILARETVSVHVKDLPADAERDAESAKSMGIVSNLVIPLIVDNSVQFVFAANSVKSERKWDDEIIARLRLLGEMFANSLALRDAELEAQHHREELARFSRISAAGELTASIAHELNQPLTAILSNAQAGIRFLSDGADLQEIRDLLTDIIEDDQRAEKIIRKLRAMVKRSETEFHPCSINDIVRAVVGMIRNDAILNNTMIQEELAENLPAAFGDQIQLQQVLLNLLLNSIESVRNEGPERRRITVRTSRSNGDFIELSVQDFGKGIPDENASRVFDAFYTTKKEGMGMGLSIAKSIVKTHGGAIWMESNTDHGVTFHFRLPSMQANV
jgi:signal transduction histidine kinase